jgi:hypothetical protein
MTKQVQEDSAAQATLRPQNKTEMLNKAILKLSGMSIEDLSHYLNDVQAQIGHEADGVGNVSGSNQSTLNMKPSAASTAMKESVKEDLGLIFGEGEDLSEEVKTSVSTLFEAALESRLVVEREELIDEMNTKLDEAYIQLEEEMATKVDAYLDAVVESWLAENEVAVESALRNELMEDFMDGLKNLFAEHYINMPEDKVDVVEELATKVADLETRLDASLTENAELKGSVLESQKNELVNSVCEGLALTSSEKLRSLVEAVEFNGDIDAFTASVNIIKESVVGAKTASSTGILVEESDPATAAGANAPEVVLDSDVARYKAAISRSVRGQ